MRNFYIPVTIKFHLPNFWNKSLIKNTVRLSFSLCIFDRKSDKVSDKNS